MKIRFLFVSCLLAAGNASAQGTEATYTARAMTPETALAAAQAALARCRALGYQTAVAVVDRAGLVQVLLRDRYAGAHTPELATNKAWTSASTRTATTALALESQAGKPMSGLRGYPRFMLVGGGLPIEGGGSMLGAIGVSGAPGGDADDVCAKAGIAAIADRIEF